MSEIKKNIEDTLGKCIHDRLYNVAHKVYFVYNSEEEAFDNRFEFTPTKLRHLNKKELLKIINWFLQEQKFSEEGPYVTVVT